MERETHGIYTFFFNPVLRAGGYRHGLRMARPLGASMGLGEEQQFRKVSPVVQAETPC